MADNSSLSNDGHENMMASRATSPDNTTSSQSRQVTDSTLVSSVSDAPSTIPAAPVQIAPANTPATLSVADDPRDAGERLDRKVTITPQTVDGVNQILRQEQQGSAGDPREEDKDREGVKESSVWQDDAVWAAENGLRKLAQLAHDLHEQDSSKSVEQYFSEHLAGVIKEIGIEVDVELLK